MSFTVEYRPETSRALAQAFLKATSPTTRRVWAQMPEDWTPATSIAPDKPQSTVSTALACLRAAGAVETRRDGRSVLYRPRDVVSVHVQVHREGYGDEEAPPCINCSTPLAGPSYTGDCPTACDEDCYEAAWMKQPVREEAT